MTVKQLMAALAKMPPNTQVAIFEGEYGRYHTVTKASLQMLEVLEFNRNDKPKNGDTPRQFAIIEY